MNRRQVLTGAALGTSAVGFMLILGWWRSRNRTQTGLDILPLPISEMAFFLSDHRGTAVIPADWLGRPTMVFFGFTYCPDICPTRLSDISDWLKALGPDADRLYIALISVDP